MLPCTSGAIVLRPTGNDQGGYYFLSLSTGQRLNQNHWTALPMPAEVIDRVHTLARPGCSAQGIEFFDRNGKPLTDNETDDSDSNSDDSNSDDESYTGSDDSNTDSDADSDDSGIEGVNENDNDENSIASDTNTVDNQPSNDNDTDSNSTDESNDGSSNTSDSSDSNFDPKSNHESDIDDDDDNVSKKQRHDSTPLRMSKEEMELKYSPHNNKHGLRPHRARDYIRGRSIPRCDMEWIPGEINLGIPWNQSATY
jgi:hypothetical protein